MSDTRNPLAGDSFVIAFPFVRDTYTAFDEEGCYEAPTWKPGIRFIDYGPEDSVAVADGEGLANFTVVGTFKPGHYPMRVFYTRRFKSPDGHWFGKSKLHIATLEKFRRLTKGYRHSYGVGEPPLDAPQPLAEARAWLDHELARARGEG